jgi:hypothetical protein
VDLVGKGHRARRSRRRSRTPAIACHRARPRHDQATTGPRRPLQRVSDGGLKLQIRPMAGFWNPTGQRVDQPAFSWPGGVGAVAARQAPRDLQREPSDQEVYDAVGDPARCGQALPGLCCHRPVPLCHRHRLPLLRPLLVALRVRRIKSIYEIRTFPGTPTPVTTTQGSASVGLLRCRNRPVGTDARSPRGCALLGDRLTSSEIAPGLRTRTGDIPGSRPLG